MTRTYFESFDAKQMLADHPIGHAFTSRYTTMSRDELRSIQDAQFRRLMTRGWQIPFTSVCGDMWDWRRET